MASSLWGAIIITIIASTANSVGKALQKDATRNLPKFSLEEKILRQYLLEKKWVAGTISDLVGGLIQIAAFALAPVSIVQPVSGVGLVGLAIYSHFFLCEKLSELEWGAVALAGLGTLGLGASSGGGGSSATDTNSASPSALRMLTVLFLVGAGVASLKRLRQKHRHTHRHRVDRHHRSGGDKTLAALYGLQAGGCFGLSAACCRTGFLMASRRWTWIPFGLTASIVLSGTGFVLQTCGLKEGSTVIVCTCVAVTSMVTGVVVGLLGLNEALPSSLLSASVRLCSWNMILIGVVVLASGPGGMAELAALVLNRVPPVVWQLLPVGVAVKVKSWAASGKGLPTTSANAATTGATNATNTSSTSATPGEHAAGGSGGGGGGKTAMLSPSGGGSGGGGSAHLQ